MGWWWFAPLIIRIFLGVEVLANKKPVAVDVSCRYALGFMNASVTVIMHLSGVGLGDNSSCVTKVSYCLRNDDCMGFPYR